MIKMKMWLGRCLAFVCLVPAIWGQDSGKRKVCYYDSESATRSGLARLEISALVNALNYCTHLVYGYASVSSGDYTVTSTYKDRVMFLHQKTIIALKANHPNLKIFLSVGGDNIEDEIENEKYLRFLEAGEYRHWNFITSSILLMQKQGFDGLDLAFPFPRTKPRQVHSKIGMIWQRIKNIFTTDSVVDAAAETHKKQFTKFVEQLSSSCNEVGLSLSLTVLPNVNSSWYFDIPTIQDKFEFINLFAFDFLTPQRNPHEADYTAPLYFNEGPNRLPYANIDFQVKHWINNSCPAQKLNLGIATYARAWKMTTKSGNMGEPVVPATDGPADAGEQTKKPGFLSWPEVCTKIVENTRNDYRGANAVVHSITDMSEKYGNYAFRPADKKGRYGIWISFENQNSVAIKARYVKQMQLGGIAIVDIAYDDFGSQCGFYVFPLLQSVYYSM